MHIFGWGKAEFKKIEMREKEIWQGSRAWYVNWQNNRQVDYGKVNIGRGRMIRNANKGRNPFLKIKLCTEKFVHKIRLIIIFSFIENWKFLLQTPIHSHISKHIFFNVLEMLNCIFHFILSVFIYRKIK